LNSFASLCSNQGLFASTETSPVAVSKRVPCRFASFGTHSAIIRLASSSGFLIDSSVLTTNFFF